MTTDEILKQSTPKPAPTRLALGAMLRLVEDGILVRNTEHDDNLTHFMGTSARLTSTLKQAQAVLAVNSYEADQALIKQLVEALEATNRANELEIDGHPLADSQIVHAHKLRDAALAAAKEHTK